MRRGMGEGGKDLLSVADAVGRIAIFLGGIHRQLLSAADPAVYQFPGEVVGTLHRVAFRRSTTTLCAIRPAAAAAAIISLQTAAIMVHKLLTRQPRLPSVQSSDVTTLQFQGHDSFS